MHLTSACDHAAALRGLLLDTPWQLCEVMDGRPAVEVVAVYMTKKR